MDADDREPLQIVQHDRGAKNIEDLRQKARLQTLPPAFAQQPAQNIRVEVGFADDQAFGPGLAAPLGITAPLVI